eukprot:NODE_101_length_20473_cov_0.516590.p4 type:complete len:395 gc:universal NODE_101_length_20473_cov_0.516590:3336-4520(+)
MKHSLLRSLLLLFLIFTLSIFWKSVYSFNAVLPLNYVFKSNLKSHQLLGSKVINSNGYYNPSVLPLPSGLNLVLFGFKVGRVRQKINGYAYNIPHYCLTNTTECSPKPIKLTIDIEKYKILDIKAELRDFEDTRCFYHPNGDVILVISCPSALKNQLRTSCIVSAQQVIPELKHIVNVKPVYPAMISVGSVLSVSEWPKNQIPIFLNSDSIYLYGLNPDLIYRLNDNGKTTILSKLYNDCTSQMLSEYPSFSSAHLGSNMLRLVLCKQGGCTPNTRNTVLIQIVHVVYLTKHTVRNQYPYYYRLFQARSIEWPYKPVFYSNPFFVDDFDPNILIYSESINYKIPFKGDLTQRDIGYLDTEVVLGCGIDTWEIHIPLLVDFTFRKFYETRNICKI